MSPGAPTGVVFITALSGFPEGGGAASRLAALGSALIDLGVNVQVLTVRPFRSDVPKTGDFRGIGYESLGGDVSSGIGGKLAREFFGPLAIIGRIARLKRLHQIDTIYYYSPENVHFVGAAWLASRLFGLRFVGERTEYPFTATMRERRPTGWNKGREAKIYRLFDGFVVISTALQTYIQPRLRSKAWLLLIPAIFDEKAFDAVQEIPSTKTVGYCGAVDSSEGMEALEVFSLALADKPEWRLSLFGRKPSKADFVTRAEALGVADRVNLCGEVGRDEIPGTLRACSIHILPRAAGEFSLWGFPTKLAEYLASGRPTAVTATGDIPNYLADKTSAILVPPGEREAFAKGLRFLADNEAEAVKIGEEGQKVARETMSNRAAAALLVERLKMGGRS